MDHARSFEEGKPPVSYTAGSMNSLVDKLTKLKNPTLEIQGLKQDLASLHEGFFHKVSERRDKNLQAEAWMKLVRELVFDIEDWLDQEPDMGDKELEIADEINSLKARVKHARELCQRYDLVDEEPTDIHDHFAVPSEATVNSRVLLEEKTGLIGMQDQKNELLKLLEDEQKMLKVVSIIGSEGLGKTTLAKEIYTNLHGKFECHAFVSVGRRPLSMTAILREILHQVKSSHSGRRETKDLREVITDLREFLCMKRYIIVVDGLWSTRAWKIINCALANNNRGSRVLVATCIGDVAKCCSVHPTDVYRMEALNERVSRWLYQKITPDPWPDDYDEGTKNMLKICDGMPLAIIVTAGLLVMKSEEKTEANVSGNSILSSLEHCSTSEGMMKVLHMSYSALSLPLKSCFLYLSVFREDYTIKKDRLIGLWIAECFIPIKEKEIRGEETRVEKTTRCEETGDEKATRREEAEGEETRGEITRGEETTGGGKTEGDETAGREEKRKESLWETGERYFNELIARRLIQPVFDYNDDQAMGCTVHGVILDFIKSMSSKGNFVTLGTDLSSGGSSDTVRRFTLDGYNNEDEDGDGTLASVAVHLSRVRSITILGDIERMGRRSALTASGKIKGTPILPSFLLTRVLDLEDTDHLKSRHLQGIGGLVLLKHLGLAGTHIRKLPEEIGELKQLEALDLRRTKLSTLPSSIVGQERLARLLIDPTVKLPDEVLLMRGLEEVSTVSVDSTSSVTELLLLLKLNQLRVLGLRLDPLLKDSVARSMIQAVSSTELTSLTLDCHYRHFLCLTPFLPSDQLRKFELKFSVSMPTVAVYMNSLVSVSHLDIEIAELNSRVVSLLGRLPNLVLLKLVFTGINSQSREGTTSRCPVLEHHGFKRLHVFSFSSRFGGMELQFTAKAMPELQRLSICFIATEALSLYGNFSLGIDHLFSLTRVHATIDCKSATASEVKNAEDAIRVQVGNLYRNPTIIFTRTHQKDMWPDYKGKVTKLLVPSKKLWSHRRSR